MERSKEMQRGKKDAEICEEKKKNGDGDRHQNRRHKDHKLEMEEGQAT